MSGKPSFERFFEQIHGRRPFPWQSRLAREVVERQRWPALLDLPTGSGKTAAIEIALYTLAVAPNVFPRRIVYVVDRRVVVDQGAEHAARIREALLSPRGEETRAVADGLRGTWGGSPAEPPFDVTVLRGGMPRDEGWARRPDRPVVVFSTVDQVGSRLLFRGYGVTPRMAPIHAGLLGSDALFLLDEVHLSAAFAETMGALEGRWRGWRVRRDMPALPDRWGIVRMSATPGREEACRFTLAAEDRADPTLSKRLRARKRAALALERVSGDDEERAQRFSQSCAKHAMRLSTSGAATLAVVVNRVDTARRVFSALTKDGGSGVDAVLLTGRMRPLDRDAILGRRSETESLLTRLAAGRTRAAVTRPLVVVSTQTIEAGADFDFDGIVTECASLDALRQRFGRVDRLGELGESRSVIVARHDQVGEKAVDPIYGQSLAATWRWLEAATASGDDEVDFGIDGFPSLPEDEEHRRSLFPAAARPPVLFPAHLDALAQTNPRPEPDPDVSLWLHGPAETPPDVFVVWRADLAPDLLEREAVDLIGERLAAVPPSSLEALSLPLHAARRWLSGQMQRPVADVEGAGGGEEDATGRSGVERRAVRLLSDRRNHTVEAEVVDASAVRPGDTLIVPAVYGGLREGNWDPDAHEPVADLGDWANLIHRGRPVLRLFEGSPLLEGFGSLPKRDSEEEITDTRSEVARWLDEIDPEAGSRLAVIITALRATGFRVLEHGDGTLTLVGRRRIGAKGINRLIRDRADEIVTEDDDSSSFIGVELPLRRHLADVERQTRTFARNLGLPEPLTADLALAAKLHDVGKADRRFQQMMVGGSEVRLALLDEPLAKSIGELRDVAARERARVRAGYPRGYRHEILSVAMLENAPRTIARAHDRDLVLHLVGSHHGWCRPFAPAVEPGAELDVAFDLDGELLAASTAHDLARLDSGIADRFFLLLERYGWWGLAWMEAIVRLADHRASEAAQASVEIETSELAPAVGERR